MHLLLSPPGDESLLLNDLSAPTPFIEALPTSPLVFCRQLLPNATAETAPSISAWANLLFSRLPADGPWQLHVFPQSGCSGASV